MNKRGYKILTVVLFSLGFSALFLTVVYPGIQTILLSLKDYTVSRGIWGSAWVGAHHYTQFFYSPEFPGLLANSLIFSLLPTVLSALMAIPVALSVGKMKAGMLRAGITVALLLPAFIPDIILTGLFVALLPSASSQLGLMMSMRNHLGLFKLAYSLLAAIKPLAVCAFAGACAAAAFKGKGKSPLRGAITGILIAQAASLAAFLSTNREQLLLWSELLFSSSFDTFDTYVYRHGLLNGNYPSASAVWAFKTGLQCAAAAVMAVVIGKRTKSDILAPGREKSAGASRAGLLFGLFAALAFALCAAGPAILRLVKPAGTSVSASASFPGATVNSLQITIGAPLLLGIAIMVFTVGLSNNFNTATVVLMLLPSAMVNNTIGNYLYMGMGLINTKYPVILSLASDLSFFMAAGHLARISKPDSGAPLGAFLSCLPYAAAFCGVIAANAWGSYLHQILNARAQSVSGVAMLLRQALLRAGTAGGASLNDLLLSVVIPVVVIAVGTSAVFVFVDRYAVRREAR